MNPRPVTFCALLALACLPEPAAGQTSRDPVRVTPTSETEVSQPKLSPDGQWVAYVSRVTYHTLVLRVRRVDGTGLRDISTIDTTFSNRRHQFTWQQRSVSTTSELLWVFQYGPYSYLNRSSPGYSGSVGILSLANSNNIVLPEKPCGDVVLGVRWNSTAYDLYDLFYANLGATSGAAVFVTSSNQSIVPIDVSPNGTRGLYATYSPTGAAQLWQAALFPGGWVNTITGAVPERRGIGAGFLDTDDAIYDSYTQTNFVAPSHFLLLWQSGVPTMISNNAFLNTQGAFANPGHLAVPATGKRWLATAVAEVPPLPIGAIDPKIVSVTPPTQGGFVWLHRAPGTNFISSVSMDRNGTRVAYLEHSWNGTEISVVDLDRELTVICTRAAGQGTISVSIPCAANELCLLGGAYGLAPLAQTLPGFVGSIELDNSFAILHIAVGTGAPVVFSGSFPDVPAMVGTTLYYQALRTMDGLVSGDISRPVFVRWF